MEFSTRMDLLRRGERPPEGPEARVLLGEPREGRGRAEQPVDEPDAGGPPGQHHGHNVERELPQAHHERPERPHHCLDAAPRHMVRGDDQQPQPERRARHEVELRLPEDLHHLRGRGRHPRDRRRAEAVGEGGQDAARLHRVVPGREEHPLLHPERRGARPRQRGHLLAQAPDPLPGQRHRGHRGHLRHRLVRWLRRPRQPGADSLRRLRERPRPDHAQRLGRPARPH
mmetsp:Transcript_88350/g.250392  ORF Transcript_88350/g.250392 Transcript_88350/m.250392 type:complete len:228 (+) Transcript_88350:257-940(+)